MLVVTGVCFVMGVCFVIGVNVRCDWSPFFDGSLCQLRLEPILRWEPMLVVVGVQFAAGAHS